MSLCAVACHCMPSHAMCDIACMPLCDIACHCVPSHAIACRRVSMHHCVLLLAIVCCRMPLSVIACHCMPSHAIARHRCHCAHCMPFYAVACCCWPLHAVVCDACHCVVVPGRHPAQHHVVNCSPVAHHLPYLLPLVQPASSSPLITYSFGRMEFAGSCCSSDSHKEFDGGLCSSEVHLTATRSSMVAYVHLQFI